MKSFATSICPIKNPLAVNMRHPQPLPAPSPRHPRIIPARRDHHPTDLKTVSFRCHNRSSAPRPCPQVLQSHLRVAKQSSIGPSARRPCPEVPQRHHPVARRSQTGHLPVSGHEIVLVSAVEVWIGCSSMKLAFFMDVEVWTWCSSMKLAFFMDIEVWTGCLSMKLAFFMDIEV